MTMKSYDNTMMDSGLGCYSDVFPLPYAWMESLVTRFITIRDGYNGHYVTIGLVLINSIVYAVTPSGYHTTNFKPEEF